MLKRITTALALLALLVMLVAGCRSLASPIQYTPLIDWQGYEAGLARAKTERKPVLLVLGADWCKPCHVFAKVFEDARIVAASKDFVVIHVNVDQREDVA